MTGAAPSRRSGRGRLIRLIFGLACFAALFFFCQPADIARTLAGSHAGWLAASFGLCLLVMAIRTYRWWRLLKDFGLPAPFRVLFEMMMVSSFFNLFLPGSVGGDAYRAYELARYSSKTLRPVATVLIERFTGVLALFLICPVAVALAGPALPFPPWTLYTACGVVLALSLGALAAGLHAERLWRLVTPAIPAGLRGRLPAEKLEALFGVLRDLRGRPGPFVRACLTGVILQIVVLTAYYTMALALRGKIPATLFFAFFPLIEFVSLIPLTVNGLGVREGLTVYFLNAAGVAPAFSMGHSIVNRLITLLLGAIGGVIFLLRRRPAASPPT
jgi:hypothetical protein